MKKSVVFMFSGQGSHYYQMGRELFESNQVFKKWMMVGDDLVKELTGESVVALIYAEEHKKRGIFKKTLFTHPAIFLIEYALAEVLLDLNIIPDYLMGTSVGEFAAATLTGAMSFEEALKGVVKQAEVIEEKAPPGVMVAILHPPSLFDEEALLQEKSEIAGINFPSHFTISAPEEAFALIEPFLKAENITYQSLPVSQAFHSRWIDAAEADYTDFLKTKVYGELQRPMISCSRGEAISAIPTDYFWEVVRQPIQFREALQCLERSGESSIYIDVGPSGTLATFVKYNLPETSSSQPLSILTPFGTDLKNLEKLQAVFSS